MNRRAGLPLPVIMFLLFAGLCLTAIVAAWAALADNAAVSRALPAGSTSLVISEFRTRGPAGDRDEFIELYNLSATSVNISGWKINSSNNAGTVSTLVTVSVGTTIPAYGHFLAVNVGYGGPVPGDQSYVTRVTDDGGIAALDSSGTIIDQVGMGAGSAYGEGTRLGSLPDVSYSWERKLGGSLGSGQDTDDNANDFQQITPADPQNLSSAPVPPATPTNTPTVLTNTPVQATNTSTNSPTTTSTRTPTATQTRTPTLTNTSTLTRTPTRTPTHSPTSTPTATATSTATSTHTPSATPTLGSPTATFTPGPVPTYPVISEFRTRGPRGGNDEFVEIYNPSDAPIDISGWKINASNSAGSTGTRLIIASGTILPPHRHFLAANSATGGYSGSTTPDQTYTTGIADDGGIGLLDSSNNRIDQVGMSSGSAYGEGTRLPPLSGDLDRSYERLPGGGLGSTQDTGDNSADFVVIAPGDPQNLASPPVPILNTPTSTRTSTRTPTPTMTATSTNTPTSTGTATSTSTGTTTPTPTCVPNTNYVVTRTEGAAIVPGTDDIGNHCADCTINVPIPFGFRLYDIEFSTVTVGANGTMQFWTNNTSPLNNCLPSANFGYAILPYWDELQTNDLFCPGCGIFTSVTGSIPNRIFNIEWRACLTQGTTCTGEVNFEVRLYENAARFDVIYGLLANPGDSATVGVQNGTTQAFTEFECNTGGLAQGTRLSFTIPACAPPTSTPSPTVTYTPTLTPTYTPTFTPTNSPTVTPTRTNTPVVSPTPTGQAFFVGHVTWQGRPAQPNALQQLPITLTLKSASIEVNFPTQNTDASGFFTVSVGTLAPGTYNWRVKGPKFLANSGSVSLPGSGTVQQEMGTLRAGDANNDNRINVTDFSILKATFGKGFGDPGYDDRADLNGDTRVNVTDFTLLRNNFGQAGAPPLAPAGSPQSYRQFILGTQIGRQGCGPCFAGSIAGREQAM